MPIYRDAGGVPGLHVLTGAFSEEIERHLFFLHPYFRERDLLGSGPLRGGELRTGGLCYGTPDELPREIYQLANVVKDSGLFPDMLTPDYAQFWSYPLGGTAPYAFHAHFDSRFRWGETVGGATLGQGCKMSYYPANKIAKEAFQPRAMSGDLIVEAGSSEKGAYVDIYLPRGSIYIMSGGSRYDFRHAIHQMSAINLRHFAPPPAWNACGARRSIILRSTKPYADKVLEGLCNDAKLCAQESGSEADLHLLSALQARIKASNQFLPAIYELSGGDKMPEAELKALVDCKLECLRELQASGTTASRFPQGGFGCASPPSASPGAALSAPFSGSGRPLGRGPAARSAEEAEAADARQLQQAILASMRTAPAASFAGGAAAGAALVGAAPSPAAGGAAAGSAAAAPGPAAGGSEPTEESRRALCAQQAMARRRAERRAREQAGCTAGSAGGPAQPADGNRAREPVVIDLS